MGDSAPDPELSHRIVTPTPHRSVLRDGVRVVAAGRDADGAANTDALCLGAGSIAPGTRAITQLAMKVVAPAPDVPVAVHDCRVEFSPGNRTRCLAMDARLDDETGDDHGHRGDTARRESGRLTPRPLQHRGNSDPDQDDHVTVAGHGLPQFHVEEEAKTRQEQGGRQAQHHESAPVRSKQRKTKAQRSQPG